VAPAKPKAPKLGDALTEQEVLYVVLVCRKPEPSKEEMGVAMGGISPRTVDRHCANVHIKWGVSTKVELYIAAVKRGVVRCPCGGQGTGDASGTDSPMPPSL